MIIPKTYKGFLKMIIAIAEFPHGFTGNLTEDEKSEFGVLIAGMENWIGENQDLLKKLKILP